MFYSISLFCFATFYIYIYPTALSFYFLSFLPSFRHIATSFLKKKARLSNLLLSIIRATMIDLRDALYAPDKNR